VKKVYVVMNVECAFHYPVGVFLTEEDAEAYIKKNVPYSHAHQCHLGHRIQPVDLFDHQYDILTTSDQSEITR